MSPSAHGDEVISLMAHRCVFYITLMGHTWPGALKMPWPDMFSAIQTVHTESGHMWRPQAGKIQVVIYYLGRKTRNSQNRTTGTD